MKVLLENKNRFTVQVQKKWSAKEEEEAKNENYSQTVKSKASYRSQQPDQTLYGRRVSKSGDGSARRNKTAVN